MNIVSQLESQQTKQDAPSLRPGETVRVHVKVVEGEKERSLENHRELLARVVVPGNHRSLAQHDAGDGGVVAVEHLAGDGIAQPFGFDLIPGDGLQHETLLG